MPTPEFWHNLAFEFRSLLIFPTIRADWVCGVGIPTGRWEIVGMNPAQRNQFEALARRAASGLKSALSSDALVAWLEALKAHGAHFRPGVSSFDGSGV